MFGRPRKGGTNIDGNIGPLNGYLQANPVIHAPTTTTDFSPRLFQRYNIAAGQFEVQLDNGLHRKIGTGLRLPQVTYLYAANPRIPGQMRDNYGGFHKRGIDPQSYNNLVQNGPGAQPSNPGGPGKMAGNYLYNPGTT